MWAQATLPFFHSDDVCGLAGMVVLCRDQAWQQVLTGTSIRYSSCLMLCENDGKVAVDLEAVTVI